MPFLSRRSVDPLTSLSPLKDRGYPSKLPDLSQNPRNRARSEASLFRRVSTLFSSRRRWSSKASFSPTNSSSVGIGYIHSCPWNTLPRVSSDSTPYSSLEIRRPSGLGRRASLIQSNDSLSDTESFGKVLSGGDTAPSGTISLPNLLGGVTYAPDIRLPHIELPSPGYTASFILPDSIFRHVLEFLPRHDLPVVSLVSRGFYSAARYALYHSLDAQDLTESSSEKLFNVLASKEGLAALVVSFHYYCWPCELPSAAGGPSSVPTEDVRRSFQNMYNLKSLTLPSFVSILSLSPSLTFSLTHLTILDKGMTQSQMVALRSWLATQPSLESLSFPHLSELITTDPAEEWVPSNPSDRCPYTTILPALKSLHASAEIVSALCFAMNNPIQSLTLNVHGTLYSGLRPGTILRALRGVRDMHIIFAPEVDKRTVEKFLGVTGSVLTGENKPEAIKSLEVEVLWTGNDAAETLYSVVTSIISRFRGLETLKLTSPFRSIQAPVPTSVSMPLHSPPNPTLLLPRTAPLAALQPPLSSHVSGITRKEFVTCVVEQSYAKTWTKHCPSLSDIQFDFSCSTTDAEVELCGVWFRRKLPLLATMA